MEARRAITMGVGRDEWGTRSPGKQYREWLRREKVMVEAPMAPTWIELATMRFGGIRELSSWVGCHERTIREIAKVGRASMDVLTRLAETLGKSEELEAFVGQPGVTGWSHQGAFCGDGRDDFAGCGTFFHEHHAEGLCKECHQGHGDPSFVPRDVRLARAS